MAEPLDEALVDIETGIRAKGTIDAADVRALRRAVYARAQVDRAAASLVLRLHHRFARCDAAWGAF